MGPVLRFFKPVVSPQWWTKKMLLGVAVWTYITATSMTTYSTVNAAIIVVGTAIKAAVFLTGVKATYIALKRFLHHLGLKKSHLQRLINT